MKGQKGRKYKHGDRIREMKTKKPMIGQKGRRYKHGDKRREKTQMKGQEYTISKERSSLDLFSLAAAVIEDSMRKE